MLNKRGEDGSERGRGMKREEMWEKGGGRENERIWITWVHEVSAFKSFLCFSQFSVLFLFPFPSFQRPFFQSFCSWPPRFSSFFIRAQMTPSSPNVLYYYKYVSIIHIFFLSRLVLYSFRLFVKCLQSASSWMGQIQFKSSVSNSSSFT